MPKRWSRNRSSKRKHHPHRHRCRLRNKLATKSRCNAVVTRGVGETSSAVPATVALSFASHPSPTTAPITTFSARHTISRNPHFLQIVPLAVNVSNSSFFPLSSPETVVGIGTWKSAQVSDLVSIHRQACPSLLSSAAYVRILLTYPSLQSHGGDQGVLPHFRSRIFLLLEEQ